MRMEKTQWDKLIKHIKMCCSLTGFNSQGLKKVWLCDGVEMQATVGARCSSISRHHFLLQAQRLLEETHQQCSARARGKPKTGVWL